MKKLVTIVLIGVLAIGFGAFAFADALSSPAEVYANLEGIEVADAYVLKGTDQTFGDLAKEAGIYDAFVAANLEGKIAMIDEKVADGTLSAEDAAAIKLEIENCEGTSSKLGQLYNLAFGRNSETRGNYAQGEAQMKGSTNENAPRIGMESGIPQARTASQSKDMSGTGSRFGQGRR
ncbi:MAG: hypothetical protein JW702_01375 [Clostridiales bacterium]|nr:hypothetical protein [Clostridiales bacterium]